MLVYIVFEYDIYENTQNIVRVFANAQDASNYCKEKNKRYYGIHHEYEAYEVN